MVVVVAGAVVGAVWWGRRRFAGDGSDRSREDHDVPANEPETATTAAAAITTAMSLASVSTTSTTVVAAVAADVAYAPLSDAQRLDLYAPATREAPFPLVVIIHGGGWTAGDKRGELPSAAIPGLLDLGYAVASVNYRLAPESVFPAQLLDV